MFRYSTIFLGRGARGNVQNTVRSWFRRRWFGVRTVQTWSSVSACFLLPPVPFALRGNMFKNLPLLCWRRCIFLELVRCMVEGLLTFNVESKGATSSALMPWGGGPCHANYTTSGRTVAFQFYVLPPRKRGRPLFIKRGDKLSHCIMDGLRRLNFHHGKMRGSTSFHLL